MQKILSGLTIFNRFKEIRGIVGRNISDLKAEYQSLNAKLYKGHIQAIEALEARLNSKPEEAA